MMKGWIVRAAARVAVSASILLPAVTPASTNTYFFNYPNRTALLADGWTLVSLTNTVQQAVGGATFTPGPQNTEITDTNVGATVSYAATNASLGTVTRIPCDIGNLWASPVSWTNGTFPRVDPDSTANIIRNSLFRSLPTNWISARLAVSFAPKQNFQQVLLMLYQDDDNYLEEEFSYNSYLVPPPFSLAGPTAITLDREFYSFPSRAFWTYYTGTNVILRLDRDVTNDNVNASYSSDGTNWVQVGFVSQGLTNPQLGIVVGGSPATFPLSSLPLCDLSRLDVITTDNYVRPGTELVVQPQHLVFNSMQDQPCVVTQRVNAVARPSRGPVSGSVTASPSWLIVNTNSAQFPGWCDVSVNTAGLTPGVYQGTLTFNATGPTNGAVTSSVSLIINPNGLVRVAPWKEAHAGAMTVWVDDSLPTAFDDLNTNGLTATYVMWHEYAPAFYTTYYLAGMELGSHTVDHPGFLVNEPTLRFELETNILTMVLSSPVAASQVISFAWPAGVTSPEEESIAAEYFLDSRGYNINQLEDQTPEDFMNLKSYNSHEHPPFPPADLKSVVDAAIAQGKWFNMVLHTTNNDNGAIAYTVGKDIWVAPGGSVTKYILQRDRTVFTNYVQAPTYLQFDCYRLPLDSSRLRGFENAVGTNDVLTLAVNVSSSQVSSLLVNGVPTAFTNRGSLLYFDTLVSTNLKTILLNLASNTPPTLPVQGNRTIDELSTLTVTNRGSDTDVPAQALTYQLVITNIADGIVQQNGSIDSNGVISWMPSEAQGPGSYRLITIATDDGYPQLKATNAFAVTVNEVNAAPILPTQPDRTLVGQQSMLVANTAMDSDIPVEPLTYHLSGPSGAGIDTNGNISWMPSADQVPGTYTFTTIVTDTNPLAVNAHSLSATNSFSVVVQTNFLVLPAQGNRTIDELTALSVTNTAILLTNLPGGGPLATNVILFNYTNRAALIADGWSFQAVHPGGAPRDTEITDPNAGVVAYAQTNASLGTVLRIPCDIGDLWQSSNSTRNSLFHSLPTNWVSLRLWLSFSPSQNFQQTHLVLYQDDDNYVSVGRAFNTFAVGQGIEFVQENNQVGSVLSVAGVSATNAWLRLDRDPGNGNVAGSYSLDGAAWTALGQVSQSFTNLQFGIWTGGSTLPYTNTLLTCDLGQVGIVTTNPSAAFTYGLSVSNTVDHSVVTNAVIDGNGVITWTPTEAQGPGSYGFTTVAHFSTYEAFNSFIVTVNEVNVPPVLPAQSNRTVAANQSLTVTNTATDADIPVNPLGYQLTGPGGAGIDNNGVIHWTPAPDQVPGVYMFTTIVTDTNVAAVNAQHLSATNSFTVTAQGGNLPPVLPIQPNQAIGELNTLTVTNTASEPSSDAVTLGYGLLNPPAGATISSNGIIRWTPGYNLTATTNAITTVVTNSDPLDPVNPELTATNTFEVTVQYQLKILTIAVSNSLATVTWTSVSNQFYRLEYQDNLANTNWTVFTPDVLAAGPLATLTNVPLGPTQRFYRVLQLP